MATIETKRSLIERALADWTPDKWCRGALAKNKDDFPVPVDDPSAVTWEAGGRLLLYSCPENVQLHFALGLEIAQDYNAKYGIWLGLDEEYEVVKHRLLTLYEYEGEEDEEEAREIKDISNSEGD